VPKYNKELLFMEFSNIWLFVIAAATLLIIPGPAVLYIMARSIDQGKKAGIVSVLGVSLGGSVHVLAGAIGVSAILMTSATAFNIVIYLGAAYLILSIWGAGLYFLHLIERLQQFQKPLAKSY